MNEKGKEMTEERLQNPTNVFLSISLGMVVVIWGLVYHLMCQLHDVEENVEAILHQKRQRN